MANYIGNQPLNGEFKRLDSIESQFNNSSTSFALTYNSVSQNVGDASQLIVSLNGVIQEPLTSYTLSGVTNIVFASPPANGDTCFIILLGGIGGTVTPSDNSVTAEKLTSNSVTSAKIVNNTITADDMDSSDNYAFNNITVATNTLVTDAVNDRIGVGTATPTYPLDVEDTGAGFIKGSFVSTGSAHSTIAFDNTGSDAASVRVGSNNNDFYVRTSGSEKMRVTSDGDVGIGTNSPSSFLHINSGTKNTVGLFQSTDTVASIYLVDNNTTGGTLASHGLLTTGDELTVRGVNRVVFDTGTTERMRITSSGYVGINNTAPSALLEVGNASDFTLGSTNGDTLESVYITYDTTNADRLVFSAERFADGSTWPTAKHRIQRRVDATNMGYIEFGGINSSSGNKLLTFGEGETERVVIDGDGNFGIGTSSPRAKFHIDTSNIAANDDYKGLITAYRPNLTFEDASASSTDFQLFVDANTFQVRYGDASTDTKLTTEAMRIDSSGNVLVSTTGSTPATGTNTGIALKSNDTIEVGTSGAAPLLLNRTSNNGNIAVFRKDGTTVGTIGTSGNFYLASNTAAGAGGIRFGNDVSTTLILPSTNAGANKDGNVNLGYSNSRFKDLYLSGGVYVGGTGSANYLDDYEEGYHDTTVTIGSGTFTYTNRRLRYIKVGNVCHVFGRLRTVQSANDVSSYSFTLPFTSQASSEYEAAHVMQSIRATDNASVGPLGMRNYRIILGSAAARMQADGGDSGNFGATDIHINVSFTYYTA